METVIVTFNKLSFLVQELSVAFVVRNTNLSIVDSNSGTTTNVSVLTSAINRTQNLGTAICSTYYYLGLIYITQEEVWYVQIARRYVTVW